MWPSPLRRQASPLRQQRLPGGHRSGPRRAGALAAVLVTAAATVAAGTPPTGGERRPASPVGPVGCAADEPGWTLATDRLGGDHTRHPFVGNGYLGQRIPPAGTGYAATGERTGFPLYTPRYNGAFVSGLHGTEPEQHDRHALAALPTWSTLRVGAGEHIYGPGTPSRQITRFHQEVNLRCGIVRTSVTWRTPDGRSTDLVYDVVADRANPHAGAVRLRMTPHWDGRVRVTDALEGAGARRIHPTGARVDGGTSRVGFATDGTNVPGSVASTTRFGPGASPVPAGQRTDGLTAERSSTLPVRSGATYEVSKFVGVDTGLTSRDPAGSAERAATGAAAGGWDALIARHGAAWQRLWKSDIRTPGRPEMQAWLRAGQYATWSSVRAGQANSIPPSGLSSDNYAGLVFWDTELWMYPSLLAQHPGLAKSVVDYRERTLPAARENARAIGQQGAFYPWTSADSGNLNTDCHSWNPPHCRTQNHLQSDVALAVWQYFQATGDRTWLREHGWPILRDLATYWAGRVTPNPDGSYSINNVAGPDEYSNGVNDAVFTNAGAATTLRHATEAARLIGEPAAPEWSAIAGALRMPFDEREGVFRQHDSYAGGQIKQADAVLLQYPLEWPMPPEVARRTLDYYAPRTDPDGPAMTDSAHAIDAAANGEPGCAANTYLERSVRPFMREPFAQFSEARGEQAGQDGGAPAMNFLTGSGGFTQVFTHGLTGMRPRTDHVQLDPTLPPQLSGGVELTGLRWQGRTFDVRIGPETTSVALRGGAPFTVAAPDGEHVVGPGAPVELKTRRPDLAPTPNVARCRPATASSEEPGRYAGAAVDGSTATTWVPRLPDGAVTADLGTPRPIGRVIPQWTPQAPVDHRVLTSEDGKHFVPWQPGKRPVARYVRVEVSGPRESPPGQQPPRAGIAELRVER